MSDTDKTARLRKLARAALLRAKGDMSAAIERLDADIIKANDIELERELTATWRDDALRQQLNASLLDLREEGVLPRPAEVRSPAPSPARQQTWAHKRVKDMERRADERRRNYLDSFLVNGEPIGDLTPETVLARADLHERDARFMRLLASGVPHGHRIREFVTPDEAEERWKMAQEAPPHAFLGGDGRAAQIMKLLARGRPLRQSEYEDAQHRVAELQRLTDPSAWDSFELDALARVMSEYEDEQR